ncbi:MAG: xanthine dehydrogenase family protein molybdopterin-binding subunit [Rhodospirillaceae bacterium]|nr:xanthine dehydrogenase family protein molybdopterin-binding subunit [Rhodospirillaceae bacterium]
MNNLPNLDPNHTSGLDRRSFLVSSAAAGGGFMLGFHIPAGQAATATDAEVNAWIVINADDSVLIRVAHSEMGQGSMTALAMLVAEELDCDWSKVRTEFVDPRLNITRNKVYGGMATVGSRAVRTSHEYLRKAGASARQMLVSAAAQRWNVPAGECQAAASVITHAASNRKLGYGAVAQAAAKLSPPKDVALKDPSSWKIAGKSTMRLDIAEKVMGKPIYAIDVALPDMLHAAIAQSPVFGGKLKSYDEAAIKNRKGVHSVVPLANAVAVVGESYWHAQRALKAMPIAWDDGANGKVTSTEIAAFLTGGLNDSGDVPVARNDGDVKAALAGAAKVIEAEYRVPFLSHAAMEPMNCTVRFTEGGLEVWAPTQNAEAILSAAARASGIEPTKIVVHLTYSGGGFGRRGGAAPGDYVDQAVLIAKAVGRPVKMVWSREEDIQHDFYRPISSIKFAAGLDAEGNPVAWNTRVAGQSILSTANPAGIKNNMDAGFLICFTDNPYDVKNIKVDYAMRNTHVPVGYWRSVNHSQNGYFRECFFDEIARAAGQDPYEYRRKLLKNAPKQLAVLDAVAKKARWGEPLPPGHFHGIAQVDGYGSYVAAVAEISMNADGSPRVHRVTTAVDCGYVVNPDSVETQLQGAVVWALSAALYGEITIKNGRVEQGNFDNYRMLLMAQMPEVDVVQIPSGGFWGGIGEPGAPPVGPAVANAMLAATGIPVRSLPIIKRSTTSV